MCEGWSQTALPKMHGASETVAVLVAVWVVVAAVAVELVAMGEADWAVEPTQRTHCLHCRRMGPRDGL